MLQLNGHTVVPILLLAIGLIAHLVSVQRDAMSHTISERAWLTSLAVDRELAAASAVVNTIADSPFIDEDSVAKLYDLAQRATARRPGSRISLVDAQGASGRELRLGCLNNQMV